MSSRSAVDFCFCQVGLCNYQSFPFLLVTADFHAEATRFTFPTKHLAQFTSAPDCPRRSRTEVARISRGDPAIRAASVIVQHARNRGVVRRFDTVYYDTTDLALSRGRSSLRVRRNGTRYVQTLKLARADQAPFVRQRWETPVDTPAPDLTRLPAEITASLGELANNGSPRYLRPRSVAVRSDWHLTALRSKSPSTREWSRRASSESR